MKQLKKLDERQRQDLAAFLRASKRSGKEARRAMAVRLIDEGSYDQVKPLTGVSERRAFTLRAKYLAKGTVGLLDRPKGKPKKLLTVRQRDEIGKIVRHKNPEDFGYGQQPGWTTAMLGAVIEEKYGVRYRSKTSLYLIFKESKFSYHLPVKRYERRDQEEVDAWRKTTTPIIRKAWSDRSTVVLAEDEMSLSSQTTVQKVWLPKGEPTEITVSKKRDSRSLYGFLNLKTGRCHSFTTKWQNMYITVEQLNKIRAIYPTEHLLILWDQAGWHRGSEVKNWLIADNNTEVIHFPAAVPDENPQERVWKAGRAAITHNQFIPKINEAADALVSHLNSNCYPYQLLGFGAVS